MNTIDTKCPKFKHYDWTSYNKYIFKIALLWEEHLRSEFYSYPVNKNSFNLFTLK